MTDRELLELAAKAAGIAWLKYVNDVTDYDSQHYGGPALQLSSSAFTWNPLISDGDALRLAVKLNLLADPSFWHEHGALLAAASLCGDRQDHYAAARRAITRAAAEIGKAM